MTTLAPSPQITPRQRRWTVKEYRQMAYPVVCEEDEDVPPLAAPETKVRVADLLPRKRPTTVNPESE